MICSRCGKEFEGSESSWCAECQQRVTETARHVDALQQICADRPDLVHYLESLLKEVTDTAPGDQSESRAPALEPQALSPNHVLWRALIGKSRPHFERCKDWQLSEKALANEEVALDPQPDWKDRDLKIKITAEEGGDLILQATWFYGPDRGGHQYDCRLVITGWDLIIHLNWLTRSIYTLFFHEPEITVIRHTGEPIESEDHPMPPADALGELG